MNVEFGFQEQVINSKLKGKYGKYKHTKSYAVNMVKIKTCPLKCFSHLWKACVRGFPVENSCKNTAKQKAQHPSTCADNKELGC